jgi:hypothetical protein
MSENPSSGDNVPGVGRTKPCGKSDVCEVMCDDGVMECADVCMKRLLSQKRTANSRSVSGLRQRRCSDGSNYGARIRKVCDTPNQVN